MNCQLSFVGHASCGAVKDSPRTDRTSKSFRTSRSATKDDYKNALDVMEQAVAMFDKDQVLVFANRSYSEMYNLPPADIYPGITLSEIVTKRIENGVHAIGTGEDYMQERLAPVIRSIDKMQCLTNGKTVKIRQRPMHDGAWVTTHTDYTERVRMETAISHMAKHDSLTGIANRTQLDESLNHAIARVRRGEHAAFIAIDLDHFKDVNDNHGHAAGDELLKQVAKRICENIRETDLAARIGGDEFAVLQAQIKCPQDAATLANRLVTILAQPYNISGQIIQIGASIGIALATPDDPNKNSLMKNADLALYCAKSDGRCGSRFFEPNMDAEMRARRQMEVDMHKAIVKEEFEIHYQPIMNLSESRVAGMEALVRWNHPEKGMIAPIDFIPLAEENGLITVLGDWVLHQACLEAARWPGNISVSVNMSSAQFKKAGPLASVRSALEKSGLAPERLEIEITESILFNDFDTALTVLQDLRKIGVKLSLDDFGTGYSSLSYLSNFPFSKIKIDRSFVKNLPSEKKSIAIMRSVSGLGASLGMSTTAEGVETIQQLGVAYAEGCTEVQGYYFSPPAPASEVLNMIRDCGVKAVSAQQEMSPKSLESAAA